MKLARTALAAALALAAMPALAQTYSQTIFFGDSLTDTGTFRPALVQVNGPSAGLVGRFTTNPGLIWAEYLADFYGTNATPSNQGGTDYAVGGARVTTNGTQPFSPTVIVPVPSLQTQVNTYLAANGGKADPNALFTVWGGANDLFAITNAGAPAQSTIATAVGGQIAIVNQLTRAGARYILVPTLPDIGATPAFRARGTTVQGQGTALSTSYNDALFGGLHNAGLRVIPLDTFHLLNEVIANPGQFGLTNVTGTACQPQITAQSISCNPGTYVNVNAPNTYLFADGVHPSLAGHAILADYAISVLEAPRQVQLLLNTTAIGNRARAETVADEALARLGDEGEGMHWWASARGDFQRYDKGDLYDGAGPSLTGGVDWKAGNLVYGGFLGFGKSAFDWGHRMGEFDQRETTLGGYVGWRAGAGWVNGQLSWSRMSYDLDRRVELGQAVRTHHGETDGRVLTAGVEGGWEFGSGALRHGPVVGVLSQRIDIDGFAEDQPTLSTSLAYPDQTFDSLLGKVGWQARIEGDTVAPYARVTIDREFEDMPEEAFARAQTLSTTGDYAVPGVGFDETYATLQFGARAKVFGLDADVGARLTQMQKAGNDASVYLTIGGAF